MVICWPERTVNGVIDNRADTTSKTSAKADTSGEPQRRLKSASPPAVLRCWYTTSSGGEHAALSTRRISPARVRYPLSATRPSRRAISRGAALASLTRGSSSERRSNSRTLSIATGSTSSGPLCDASADQSLPRLSSLSLATAAGLIGRHSVIHRWRYSPREVEYTSKPSGTEITRRRAPAYSTCSTPTVRWGSVRSYTADRNRSTSMRVPTKASGPPPRSCTPRTTVPPAALAKQTHASAMSVAVSLNPPLLSVLKSSVTDSREPALAPDRISSRNLPIEDTTLIVLWGNRQTVPSLKVDTK